MPANRPTYRAPGMTPRTRWRREVDRPGMPARLGTPLLWLLVGAIGVLTVVVVSLAGYAIVLVPLVVVVGFAVFIDRQRGKRARPPLRSARPPRPPGARPPASRAHPPGPGARPPAPRGVRFVPPPRHQTRSGP